MSALGVGLHENVPEAMYHADPCETPSLSASLAKVITTRSLLHAHHTHPALGAGRSTPTKEMDAGKIMHALILPGQDAGIAELDFDAFRSNAAKEARDQALAAGKIPILKHKLAPQRAAARKILERLSEYGFDFDGQSELCAVWNAPVTRDGSPAGEVVCRGLLDHWRPAAGAIWDLKTCASAHPKAIQKSIEMYGYHIQEAAYTEAIETLHPELAGRVEFTFLFAETEAPFAVTPARTDESMKTVGRLHWEKAKEKWQKALLNDDWPGYGASMIEASPWALDAMVKEEMEAGDDA